MLGEDTAEEDLPGTFNAAPVWGRISVVAAGPVFNFILAFILSVIITGFVGYDPAEIMEVTGGFFSGRSRTAGGRCYHRVQRISY